MPVYQNECTEEECSHQWETIQSYEDEAVKVCPICGEPSRRVFSLGYISIKNANTLGALADQNNKKLGGKRDELIRQMKEERKPQFHGMLPNTAEVMPKSDKVPFWRNPGEPVDMSLAKMTSEQTKKYVETGKKPIPSK